MIAFDLPDYQFHKPQFDLVSDNWLAMKLIHNVLFYRKGCIGWVHFETVGLGYVG